ncbi:MAG: general secretion pathway protein GspK [Opitutales bacterium]
MLTPPPTPRSRAALAPDPLRPGHAQKKSDGKPIRLRSLRSSRDGSVLIAVLAIILLLSFLITKFMEEALENLEYRSIFNEPVDVRSYAYSILELSLATIQEVALIDGGNLYAAEQGWGNPLSYANVQVPNGWNVSVQITDEGGKLPINTMDEALLNKMLEETFDFDFGTARELSSMLLDWIDPDDIKRLNGAESEDYLRRNPPYRAANGPLQSLEELRLIKVWEDEFFNQDGQPNERFMQLSRLVSVYYSGVINLNNAPAEVLELLALHEGYDEDFLFDGLDQPYLTQTPASANPATSGVEAKLLRVTVSLRRGNVPYTISALVEPNFSTEGAASGAMPGRRSRSDSPRTGTKEEQDAINYPFTILQLSEYDAGETALVLPARHSALDMEAELPSF